MLDITHQCNAMARRNATLMSECVVAESEARADLLSHWSKLPDEAAERCIKLGRKAKRQPYVAMVKVPVDPTSPARLRRRSTSRSGRRKSALAAAAAIRHA